MLELTPCDVLRLALLPLGRMLLVGRGAHGSQCSLREQPGLPRHPPPPAASGLPA